MAESDNANIMNAVKSNGFVDFYELLGQPTDATTTRLRGRINDLYSEAQANRDHRNMAKRREYETLLELLPQCRTALLDENKRARYDAYAAEAREGNLPRDFEAFMNDLSGKSDADTEERASLLASAQAAAKKTPASAAPKKRVSHKAQTSLMGSAIAVIAFFFVVIIMTVALKQSIGLALVVGGIIGVVIWIATYMGNKKKISR